MCKNAHVDAQICVEKSAYTHEEICNVDVHAGASVHLSQGLEDGHTKREKVNGVDLPELSLSWVNTLRLQILAKGNNWIITGILPLTGRPWVSSQEEDSGLIKN